MRDQVLIVRWKGFDSASFVCAHCIPASHEDRVPKGTTSSRKGFLYAVMTS